MTPALALTVAPRSLPDETTATITMMATTAGKKNEKRQVAPIKVTAIRLGTKVAATMIIALAVEVRATETTAPIVVHGDDGSDQDDASDGSKHKAENNSARGVKTRS